MPDALMLSVSGCRGVVGSTLTADVAARFAGAFGSFVRERAGGRSATVVVGRDGRKGGEMVRNAALAGLAGAGCRVVDLGIAMTPTVAVMTDWYARDVGPDGVVAGMVLTASHNPQQWNGLKCLLGEGGLFGSAAAAPPASIASQVIERFKSGGSQGVSWQHVGDVVHDDAGDEEHVDRLLLALEESGLCEDASSVGAGLSVALDSVNASGINAGRRLLEALGCEEILHLGIEETGLFPHPPEPTAENLNVPGGLCEAVREGECAVGFAQDPDGDRLALVDETGRYVGEEYTLALGAMALLGAGGGAGQALVTNLSTSRMLDDVAAKFGARVLRTPVGEANVVEVMKQERALAGGEGNGGVIWPRVAYVRDSLAAMALTICLLSGRAGGGGKRRKFSELCASIPSYAIVKRKVELTKQADAAGAIEAAARAFSGEKIDRRDGAWIDLPAQKAWVHVRASNTEPIVRLIAEAPTREEAERLLDRAAAAAG